MQFFEIENNCFESHSDILRGPSWYIGFATDDNNIDLQPFHNIMLATKEKLYHSFNNTID